MPVRNGIDKRSDWSPSNRAASMPGVRAWIGELELIGLTDAVGTLGRLDRLFPDVPEQAWEPYRRRYPDLFDGPSWRLRFGCFVISTPSSVVLVDAGVGPPPGAFLPERQGRLPAELATYGLDAGDVDVLFLTHLHIDHVGWTVDELGAPIFPRARYVTHVEGWQWAERHRRAVPVAPARLVELVQGETELAPGVTVFPTPGHSPGHMSVRLESAGSSAFVLGDVAVHPAQLERTDWRYVDDEDGAESITTRQALLRELDERTVVACGHYPGGGIGRLSADHVWEPLQ
jgi:glyoxylase-like metal-dependent hydrolase (beta-lactamase superfamily II)